MFSAFKMLILIFLIIAIGSLLFGLVRPVYALWFLDRFNRLRVIKIYGGVSLILFAVWVLLSYLA